jgi:4-hydroxy-tetrahydrodipicolinate synthase
MPRLGGAITALVTPFRHRGLDRPAFRALAEWQILSGVDGLAVCSVSGEGPTLSPQERAEVIDLSIQSAAGRVPVVAATGTNSTESTIALTREAEALGAAAALVTVPYYSKPGQKGIIHHFEQVAAASRLPVIVDHAPAQTASDLSTETLGRLAAIPGLSAFATRRATSLASPAFRPSCDSASASFPAMTLPRSPSPSLAATARSRRAPTFCQGSSPRCSRQHGPETFRPRVLCRIGCCR